jgi:uncharacterized membrane protein
MSNRALFRSWSDRPGLAARRLIVATGAGAVILASTLIAGGTWTVAVTGGWSVAAAVFLVWVWLIIGRKDAGETARWARAEDVSRATADAILLTASVASLVAVGFTLIAAGHKSGVTRWLMVALAITSVSLAWATVQTLFTARYGDLYYTAPIGGIDFNEDDEPDYIDFAYVALTIGMTYQVSDTDLQAKVIRRTAVRHALISWVFGVVIIAITINIVAGLVH